MLRSPTGNSWTSFPEGICKLSFRKGAGFAQLKKREEKVLVTVLVLVLALVLLHRAAKLLRHFPGKWEQVQLLFPYPQLRN